MTEKNNVCPHCDRCIDKKCPCGGQHKLDCPDFEGERSEPPLTEEKLVAEYTKLYRRACYKIWIEANSGKETHVFQEIKRLAKFVSRFTDKIDPDPKASVMSSIGRDLESEGFQLKGEKLVRYSEPTILEEI